MQTFHSYGPSNWLIRWDSRCETERVLSSLLKRIDSEPPPQLQEYVPGFQTLLLLFDRDVSESEIRTYLENDDTSADHKNTAHSPIEIPVIYDGPDLASLADTHGISEAEVIRKHSSPLYSVEFMGFSPGFPYLGPLDPSLYTPRMKSPRTRIPAGSVAIGGSHTGIYSVDSPGGWNIIGHTTLDMFHLNEAHKACPESKVVFTLQPGDRVKLIPQF